eukprot:g5063.t1
MKSEKQEVTWRRKKGASSRRTFSFGNSRRGQSRDKSYDTSATVAKRELGCRDALVTVRKIRDSCRETTDRSDVVASIESLLSMLTRKLKWPRRDCTEKSVEEMLLILVSILQTSEGLLFNGSDVSHILFCEFVIVICQKQHSKLSRRGVAGVLELLFKCVAQNHSPTSAAALRSLGFVLYENGDRCSLYFDQVVNVLLANAKANATDLNKKKAALSSLFSLCTRAGKSIPDHYSSIFTAFFSNVKMHGFLLVKESKKVQSMPISAGNRPRTNSWRKKRNVNENNEELQLLMDNATIVVHCVKGLSEVIMLSPNITIISEQINEILVIVHTLLGYDYNNAHDNEMDDVQIEKDTEENVSVEFRVDSTNGKAYTQSQFLEFYAEEGLVRWNNAKPIVLRKKSPDRKKRNVINTNKEDYSYKIRTEAIKLCAMIAKHMPTAIQKIWQLFMNEASDNISLQTLLLQDKSASVRSASAAAIGTLLQSAPLRLWLPEDTVLLPWQAITSGGENYEEIVETNADKNDLPSRVSIARSLEQLYNVLTVALRTEKIPRHLIVILNCVEAVVTSTPHDRLHPALLCDTVLALRPLLTFKDMPDLQIAVTKTFAAVLDAGRSREIESCLLQPITSSASLLDLFIAEKRFKILIKAAGSFPNVLFARWKMLAKMFKDNLTSLKSSDRVNILRVISSLFKAQRLVREEYLKKMNDATNKIESEGKGTTPFFLPDLPGWTQFVQFNLRRALGDPIALVRTTAYLAISEMGIDAWASLPIDTVREPIINSATRKLEDRIERGGSERAAASKMLKLAAFDFFLWSDRRKKELVFSMSTSIDSDAVVGVRAQGCGTLSDICAEVQRKCFAHVDGRGEYSDMAHRESNGMILREAGTCFLRALRDCNDKVVANAVRGLGIVSSSLLVAGYIEAKSERDMFKSEYEFVRLDIGEEKSNNEENVKRSRTDSMVVMIPGTASAVGESRPSDMQASWILLRQMLRQLSSLVSEGPLCKKSSVKIKWNACLALEKILCAHKELTMYAKSNPDADGNSVGAHWIEVREADPAVLVKVLATALCSSSNFKVRTSAAQAVRVGIDAAGRDGLGNPDRFSQLWFLLFEALQNADLTGSMILSDKSEARYRNVLREALSAALWQMAPLATAVDVAKLVSLLGFTEARLNETVWNRSHSNGSRSDGGGSEEKRLTQEEVEYKASGFEDSSDDEEEEEEIHVKGNSQYREDEAPHISTIRQCYESYGVSKKSLERFLKS